MLNAIALPRDEVRCWRTAHDWTRVASHWNLARMERTDGATFLASSRRDERPDTGLPSPAEPHASTIQPGPDPVPSQGFTLQEIPHLEDLWRRTGQTPILRAKRQIRLPALELPAGLHMLLTLNGQKLRLLRPGLNIFTPELLLLPGDRLRFEFYLGERLMKFTSSSTHVVFDAQAPTEADLYLALFGRAPCPQTDHAKPSAGLTRFQRGQRGFIARLISSLKEGV